MLNRLIQIQLNHLILIKVLNRQNLEVKYIFYHFDIIKVIKHSLLGYIVVLQNNNKEIPNEIQI